jgi:hypothetical protein
MIVVLINLVLRLLRASGTRLRRFTIRPRNDGTPHQPCEGFKID